MLLRLVLWSARYRVLVSSLAVALIVLAGIKLRSMPVDVLPEFAQPMVEVQTEALGLSASEVESLITLNLEELLSSVPWLSSIRSQSLTGLSSIQLLFQPGTDVMRARQMIQERLTLAYTLPNVSKPPTMLQPLSATSRVMTIGVSSKSVPLIRLSVLAQWNIKTKLLGVPGVANVVLWGERRRQLQVQVEPEKLRTHGVTQDRVISSSGDSLWVSFLSYLKSSVPGTGGWIDGPQQRLEIRHLLPVSSPSDLARVAVDGAPTLRLGDIATVVEQHPLLIGDSIVDGAPGLVLVVEKFPWANTLEVTRGVEKAIATMKPGLPDVDLNAQVFRPASYIESASDNISSALIIGSVLATLLVALSFFDLRLAVLNLIIVPFSLLAALLVLHWGGASVNLMVLVGLMAAVVPLVDDTIKLLDRIGEHLRAPAPADQGKSKVAIVASAVAEMQRSSLYAMIILALLVVPVFSLSGLMGSFVAPMVTTYLLALAASAIVATTATPALALLLYGDNPARRRVLASIALLREQFDKALARFLSAPSAVAVCAGVLFLAAGVVWPMLGHSLLPAFKERDFLVTWTAPPGASHGEVQRVTQRVVSELQKVPGVRFVTAQVGRAIQGDQLVGINSSQIWVTTTGGSQYHETLAGIREIVTGYPGMESEVRTYLKDRVSEVERGSSRPIVVRVFGHDRSAIRDTAEDIRGALSKLSSLSQVQIQGVDEEPVVQVKVDIEKAGAVGLKPGDIRRAASTIFAGLEVGRVFEAQKVFEVVVWSTPNARNSLSSIADFLLATDDHGSVRLRDIADVQIVSSPSVIKHEAISNYLDVVADLNGSSFAEAQREVERTLQSIKFPLETHAELRGAYAQQLSAHKRTIAISVGSIVLIFLLLQAAFSSWRLAASIFLALPVALTGSVLATYAGERALSFGVMAGLLAVLGFTVRNAVMLVRHYQDLEQEGRHSRYEAALRGTSERAVPITVSAAAIALLLVPGLFFGALPGFEVIQPMTVAILGGLVTSIIVTLLVIPVLYVRFGSGPRPDFERLVGHAE